jgi:hypothetical protein
VATKWEINRAVRASDLPAPSRLIMLTLSDMADAATAEIPERHTPSLTELARQTGLGRSTVAQHLLSLEEAKWVVRDRPEVAAARANGERTCYRLSVPAGAPVVQEPDQPDDANQDEEEEVVQELDYQTGQVVQELDHSATGVVQELDGGSPGAGPNRTISTTYKPSSSEADTTATTPPPKKTKNTTPKPERPDVERVCRHLADRIVANGCRPPTITDRWRDAARLLIDKDGKTVDQIVRCIDWATADEFWKANILSMPTLRAKYDQLSLSAQRQRNGTKPVHTAPPSTAPGRIPKADQCPDHADQRAVSCRHCAARAKAGTPR